MKKIKNGIFLFWAGLVLISALVMNFLALQFLEANMISSMLLTLILAAITKLIAIQILKLPKIIEENFIKKETYVQND